MKFLPLPSFDEITSALNFDTQDCHIVGGCDLYTTKAAGPDKKLYKTIENGLESQYESLLRLSASLSPPHASTAAESLNLARSSPFGPLSEHSSRRTYAYLIATLNASHPDYDFSHLLRPSDFKREKSLKRVINTIDSTLFNLRPNMARDVSLHAPYVMSSSLGGAGGARGHQHAGAGMGTGTGTRLSPSGNGNGNGASPFQLAASVPPNGSGSGSGSGLAATAAAAATETAGAAATSCSWGPRMWKLIDDQMTLNECSIYSYSPEEDPYEGDEGEEDGAIWSLKYFFFNKSRKRVCYLYLKGISVLSGSYREHRLAQGIPIGGTAAANAMGRRGYGFGDSGFDTSDAEDREKDNEDSVKKKARYWLGEYAAIKMRRNIDSDDDSDFNDLDDDEEEEEEKRGATRQPQVVDGDVDGDVEMILDDEEEEERQGPRTRQMVRERELARKKTQGARIGGDRGQRQRRRSRSPRGSKSSGGVSEQMAGMMEV